MARRRRRYWWQDAAGGLLSVAIEVGVVAALAGIAFAAAAVMTLIF